MWKYSGSDIFILIDCLDRVDIFPKDPSNRCLNGLYTAKLGGLRYSIKSNLNFKVWLFYTDDQEVEVQKKCFILKWRLL